MNIVKLIFGEWKFIAGLILGVLVAGGSMSIKHGDTEIRINELAAENLSLKSGVAGLARVIQCSNGAECK